MNRKHLKKILKDLMNGFNIPLSEFLYALSELCKEKANESSGIKNQFLKLAETEIKALADRTKI